MIYQEALLYLESFVNYEKIDSYDYRSSLKLEKMKRFAALLGDPQNHTRSIHVAGTKGKGSTAAFIYSILSNAGFKVGLYTSPHLVDFRERIRINGELISEEDLSSILDKIRNIVENYMKDDRPSFFEVYTALAYLYFKDKKCDFAVYEVGLGGRLDATNLIEPLVCVITPLSYEHMDKLGNTLEEIASEKCGIIKSGSICVSAPQDARALKIIEKTCDERGSRLILVGRDIIFKEISYNDTGEVFDIYGASYEYHNLKSRLLGAHQIINAATAIGVIESLKARGVNISEDAVKGGVEAAKWDGRLEVLGKNPYIVLDGAQNKASAGCLADAVKKVFKYRKLILVLGVSKDKDLMGILGELMPISDSAIFTKSSIVARAMEPEKIIEAARKIDSDMENITTASSVKEALDKALSSADKRDLILVTGSLFVVGEAKSYLAEERTVECTKIQ
ncbi:MAG: folylpolyglutamate synthase/dihydrofolate synthase family protein [Candidatus Omnitrophota bacterium]|nr:folylpolyglutamate synthase/dihydrofolate synthase family protein [Candidatus Omnitrophota bacterium]